MKILQTLPKLYHRLDFDWFAAALRLPERAAALLRYVFSETNIVEPSGFTEKNTNILPQEAALKHISFTFAAISLSALVARADGTVSRDEYLAFRDSFPLSGGLCGKIRQLFLLACQSKTPYTHHIQQIKNLFPNKKELFLSLADRLFRIAVADKPLTRAEERLLAKISHALDISPSEYSALHDRYSRPLAPHIVLGVAKRSPREIIKKRYHALMNRYHPDRYSTVPISPEVKMLLTLKSAEVNNAYNILVRKAA